MVGPEVGAIFWHPVPSLYFLVVKKELLPSLNPLNPAFLLIDLAVRARNNATELRLAAHALQVAAGQAQENAEAIENLICLGTDEQIAAAVTALVEFAEPVPPPAAS